MRDVNVHSSITRSVPIKLTVEDFLRLRVAGAFPGYSTIELLDGELFGVPRGPEGEPETDESLPLKLSVRDFLMLADAGAFDRYERTELHDGVAYAMSPEFRPHAYVNDELHYHLRCGLDAIGSELRASSGSLWLSEFDMPMPDIALTSEARGPGPIQGDTVALVVEVSSTTLAYDSSEKADLYAREGIPEYWVVDVDGAQIHQHWQPADGAYAQRRAIPFGTDIASVTIANLTIVTDTLR